MPWDEATVHCLSHTFHYGSGAFEGIRFYLTDKGPAIFKLDEHVARLVYSAQALGMKVPYTTDELKTAIIETVRDNELEQGYIRPVVYYGNEVLRVNPEGNTVHVMIAAWPWGAYLAGDQAISVATSSYVRIHPKSTIADAKINGHYVNSLLANQEAKAQGADEGLLLDFEGNVAEGPGENIFMVTSGGIVTPRLGSILAGITRATVLEIAQDLGYPVEERVIRPEELLTADELFFTGTAAEISPIGTLDGHQIGNGQMGDITKRIRENYMDIVYGRHRDYQEWLTFIK